MSRSAGSDISCLTIKGLLIFIYIFLFLYFYIFYIYIFLCIFVDIKEDTEKQPWTVLWIFQGVL